MSDEYGSDFITLTDEDGNEVELEHLDTLEYEDETYMAFGISDPENEEEETAVVIMTAVEVDGEEMLEEVQDEALLEEVYRLFLERIEEDPEDEDE
ncbi:MAG: DUF1292 domain-containing protein [Oscillospiraceae bacterium]|nr:DUF1292 domain-containing protein [Oscillospiraceae bacterium]